MATLTNTVGIPAWVQARRAEAIPAPRPFLPLPPPPPGDTLTLCHKKTYFGNAEEPPEYCPEEARPGTEYCADHGEPGDDPSWDRYRERNQTN